MAIKGKYCHLSKWGLQVLSNSDWFLVENEKIALKLNLVKLIIVLFKVISNYLYMMSIKDSYFYQFET